MSSAMFTFSLEQAKRLTAVMTPQWEKGGTLLKRAGIGMAYLQSLPTFAKAQGWEATQQRIKGSQTASVYRLPPNN